MRLATIGGPGSHEAAAIEEDRYLPIVGDDGAALSVRSLASADRTTLDALAGWVTAQPSSSWLRLNGATLGPAVPDPGAIFTIGANYPPVGEARASRPERPMVLGKLPSSVTADGATVTWDRSLTANVDGECELGVVIGRDGGVFGYTIIDDMNSVDPWLDGSQWLLGKSMAGFCPVGPWIVTADELDPADLRLGATLNGEPIQDGRTSQMRSSIDEVIAYIGRHVTLNPGDLIATGTPARLPTPPGRDRHLEPGDTIACWIEGIGELTTRIA